MKHILIIDLHAQADELFHQLTAQGYYVHKVNNAFDALVKMETLTLEAILLDFAVPKMVFTYLRETVLAGFRDC